MAVAGCLSHVYSLRDKVREKLYPATQDRFRSIKVQPGSGELMYYEGSHRLPDWLYSGAFKHYNHERDKHEEHMAHLKSLVDRSEERGLKLTTFLPKKGDALIWAADLAHGGSEIGDPALTRRSLVTHYTDASTKPYYFRFLPQDRQKVVQVKPGCAFTSMYY